jgi:hypothetical protein
MVVNSWNRYGETALGDDYANSLRGYVVQKCGKTKKQVDNKYRIWFTHDPCAWPPVENAGEMHETRRNPNQVCS